MQTGRRSMAEECWWMWNGDALSKDGGHADLVVDWVEPGEVGRMSTSSTRAEMMPRVMMIAPWAVTGTEASVGNAAGTETESVASPAPAKDADVPGPANVNRETNQPWRMQGAPGAGSGTETERSEVRRAERGAATGTARGGAEVVTARETGNGPKGPRAKTQVWETVLQRVESGGLMSSKEER